MANRINIDFEYAIKETALQRYQDEITLINQKINTGVIEGNEYLNFLNVYKNSSYFKMAFIWRKN